jgi:Zn-dependent M28 family amino/carboxypeptidase
VIAAALGDQAWAAQTQAAPQFDSNRAWEHLRQIVAIGPRPSGSAGLDATRKYIRTQLGLSAIAVADQQWDAQTPIGTVRMVNLRATIPGRSPDRILLTGHYDTKLFRTGRFVGANDGGSSTAFLLEMARVLKARSNPLTIELVFLDGEEAFCQNWTDCGRPGAPDNTYGSRHYVAAARRDGTLSGIKANLLVDMIADRDLRLKRDVNSSAWLTDLVWGAARASGLGAYFVEETTQIEDDHLPFIEAGVPSVDLIDLEYPAWHTPADTLDQVSARSLQVVGDAVLAALPRLEARLAKR